MIQLKVFFQTKELSHNGTVWAYFLFTKYNFYCITTDEPPYPIINVKDVHDDQCRDSAVVRILYKIYIDTPFKKCNRMVQPFLIFPVTVHMNNFNVKKMSIF